MKAKSTLSAHKNVVLRKRKIASGYTLYLDMHINGKRQKEYLKLFLTGDSRVDKETLALANTITAQRVIELQNDEYDRPSKTKANADFIAYFRLQYEKSGLKQYKNTLNHLLAFTEGSIPFKRITPAWLESFQEYLGSKVSRNSVATYYSCVKATLNKAMRDGIIKSNPAQLVKAVTTVSTNRTYLTIEELRLLNATECPRPQVKLAFLFCCYTGLRISDVKRLTKQNLIHGELVFKQQKTKEPVTLPLSKNALKYLPENKTKDYNTPLFGLFTDDWKTNKWLKVWAKNAGITKNITFHVARHTYATLSLTYGADLFTISKLLGHTDIKHTQIYTKVIDSKKRQAVDLLPDL
ncbi:MAG: site-specific integrase [Bacteriodetes bacterium]|nr:site-specific integrase [Bacteroidota bacterium]